MGGNFETNNLGQHKKPKKPIFCLLQAGSPPLSNVYSLFLLPSATTSSSMHTTSRSAHSLYQRQTRLTPFPWQNQNWLPLPLQKKKKSRSQPTTPLTRPSFSQPLHRPSPLSVDPSASLSRPTNRPTKTTPHSPLSRFSPPAIAAPSSLVSQQPTHSNARATLSSSSSATIL